MDFFLRACLGRFQSCPYAVGLAEGGAEGRKEERERENRNPRFRLQKLDVPNLVKYFKHDRRYFVHALYIPNGLRIRAMCWRDV